MPGSPRTLARVTKGTWLKLVATSFVGAALIAAAQLGVGQAMSIIDVGAYVRSSSADGHHRLTAWLVLIFAAAVLGGAAIGRRSIRRRLSIVTRQVPARRSASYRIRAAVSAARGPVALAAARLSATIAAGLGAASAYPLIWVPAHAANVAAAGPAETALAITSAIGLAIGMVLAFCALAATAVGAGLAASVAWVWMCGIASVVLALGKNQPVRAPRLAVIDVPSLVSSREWWFGPYFMVGVAAALSALVSAGARWVGANRLGIAVSGFAGPALIATTYIVAGPGLGNDDSAQMAPYLAAVLAAVVGLGVSAAIAAARGPRRHGYLTTTPALTGPLTGTVVGAAAGGAPLAIAGAPGSGRIYQPQPRRPPLVVESRVIRAEPPRRIEAGNYIEAEPVDARARAQARQHAQASAAAEAKARGAAKARPAAARAQPAPAPAQPAPARPAPARVQPATAARPAGRDAAKAAAKAQEAAKADAAAAALAEAERQSRAQAKARAQADARARAEAKAQADRDAQAARAKTESRTPTSPASGAKSTGPGPGTGKASRRSGRSRGGRTKDGLRKRELEHIDWVTNLVNLPHDPELRTRRGS